jgi:hypothetical protein
VWLVSYFVHTLRFEKATWNSTSSPTCDLCEDDRVQQDEKHALFHSTHPQMNSLGRKYAFLFLQAGSQDVSFFAPEENNKHNLFFHELILLYEQASSHTS